MASSRPGSLSDRLRGAPAVLAVEDEPDIAMFLGAFFRASGVDLVHVDPVTPTEVVTAAVDHGVNCVLLDLRLNGFTGFDVLTLLQADDRLRSVPVVVVTADDREETRRRADELGASGFVPKPFNVKELFALATGLIRQGQAPPAEPMPLLLIDELQRSLDDAAASSTHEAPTTFALVRLIADHDGAPDFALVTSLADQLASTLPEGAVLGCSAPDEVAILLALAPDDACTRLVEAVERLPGEVTVRIGAAAAPTHAADGDGLYMATDSALAEAGEANQIIVTAR